MIVTQRIITTSKKGSGLNHEGIAIVIPAAKSTKKNQNIRTIHFHPPKLITHERQSCSKKADKNEIMKNIITAIIHFDFFMLDYVYSLLMIKILNFNMQSVLSQIY